MPDKSSDTLFDSYADRYQSTVEASIRGSQLSYDYLIRRRHALMTECLALTGKPLEACSVLDFGCGVGDLAAALATTAREVRGEDVSSSAVEEARSKYGAGSGNLSFETIGTAPDGTAFDAAVTVCVLHHIEPPERPAAMRDLVSRLAPGGRLIVYEHNPYNPATQWIVSRCPFDEDAELLTPREVRRLMVEAGLVPDLAWHVMLTPFQAGWSLGLEKLLRPVPLAAQYMVVGHKPGGAA